MPSTVPVAGSPEALLETRTAAAYQFGVVIHPPALGLTLCLLIYWELGLRLQFVAFDPVIYSHTKTKMSSRRRPSLVFPFFRYMPNIIGSRKSELASFFCSLLRTS